MSTLCVTENSFEEINDRSTSVNISSWFSYFFLPSIAHFLKVDIFCQGKPKMAVSIEGIQKAAGIGKIYFEKEIVLLSFEKQIIPKQTLYLPLVID